MLVVDPAFRLSATHDTLSRKAALALGYDGPLSFPVVLIVEIDHHPIACSVQLMSVCRIGKHDCELPVGFCGVQNGQPGLTLGVESFGRDSIQSAVIGSFSVFLVDGDQEINRRFCSWIPLTLFDSIGQELGNCRTNRGYAA
jgi:hypothetical protein